jgi:hypothetical protein
MTEKLLESTVSLAIREVMGSNFNPESIYLYWNIVSETSDISLTHTVPYSFGTVCFFFYWNCNVREAKLTNRFHLVEKLMSGETPLMSLYTFKM